LSLTPKSKRSNIGLEVGVVMVRFFVQKLNQIVCGLKRIE